MTSAIEWPRMDRAPAGANAAQHVVSVAVLLIAALVYWSPILVDPVGRVAGGNGDPLFIAYIVTWVASHFGDAALWHPPFFHPATDVLAYRITSSGWALRRGR